MILLLLTPNWASIKPDIASLLTKPSFNSLNWERGKSTLNLSSSRECVCYTFPEETIRYSQMSTAVSQASARSANIWPDIVCIFCKKDMWKESAEGQRNSCRQKPLMQVMHSAYVYTILCTCMDFHMHMYNPSYTCTCCFWKYTEPMITYVMRAYHKFKHSYMYVSTKIMIALFMSFIHFVYPRKHNE